VAKGKNTDVLTARVSDDLAQWARYKAEERNLSVSGFIAALLKRERDSDKGNVLRRILGRLRR
jgi:hypothetical protein